MNLSRKFDRIAIALSAICIVHCLGVTLIVSLLPLAVVAFGGHFHGLMLWLLVPTSAIGFFFGYREHKRALIVLSGLGAVGLISYATLVGHGQWEEWVEAVVTSLSGFMLVGAHWLNFQEVRRVHVHVHH